MNEMRETQMKKIIALAVAGAFVAPAFAADVTVTGESEMQYVTTSGSTDAASNADNVVVVTASDEIDGVSISTSIVLDVDALNDSGDYAGDGSSLTIGANGITLAMGDVSGAMDAVGDYTDISPAHGGFDADGDDHSFLLTLPAMGGVQAYVSMSPTTGFDGSTADSTGYGAKVGVGAGEVYFGGQEDADSKWQAYGVKYTMGNIYVAYERGSDDAGSSADVKYTGFAAKYTMGDLVAGFEMQETKTDGSAASEDETITFLEYNLGSSVDIYIAREDNADATGTADQTTVGVEYVF
jgi:hypothetical protein